jgi:hypothetical protein
MAAGTARDAVPSLVLVRPSNSLALGSGLRHTFVTTMLDAGVDLRDVQIAARHADPRTRGPADHDAV